jgi:hypothetical protein
MGERTKCRRLAGPLRPYVKQSGFPDNAVKGFYSLCLFYKSAIRIALIRQGFFLARSLLRRVIGREPPAVQFGRIGRDPSLHHW